MSERYQTLERGRKYKLSDGTELSFLGRDSEGVVGGVSVEEVLAVVIARLDAQRESGPNGRRYLSLAITEIESAENWVRRWHEEVLKVREQRERESLVVVVKQA